MKREIKKHDANFSLAPHQLQLTRRKTRQTMVYSRRRYGQFAGQHLRDYQ